MAYGARGLGYAWPLGWYSRGCLGIYILLNFVVFMSSRDSGDGDGRPRDGVVVLNIVLITLVLERWCLWRCPVLG